MKFARYLAVLQRDAPPRWTGKFIDYKQLKKLLKLCLAEGAVSAERERVFFDALEKEMVKVNKSFHREAERVVAAFQSIVYGNRVLCCFIPLRRSGPRQWSGLAEQAYWCRKYARANAVALRKILKKHDKLCSNDSGRRFLQKCWGASAYSAGLFLHSPLLDELRAVQDVLQRRADTAERVLASKDGEEEGGGAVVAQRASASAKRDGQPVPAASGAALLPPSGAAATGAASPASRSAHAPPPAADAGIVEGASPAAAAAHALRRTHVRSAPASVAGAGPGSPNALVRASLRAQQAASLAAVVQDPACMLDSSEIEWGADSPRVALPGGGRGGSMQWGNALAGPLMPPQPGSPLLRWPEGLGVGMGDRLQPRGVLFDADPDAPLPPARSAPGDGPSSGGGGGAASSGGASSGVGPASGPFSDEDLRCPICLDIMYKPVGLGCGHKYCRPCALGAAGFGRTHGAFHNIVSYIPARTPCPQCRQPNAYRSAVALKEVGALIKERFPEDWERRRVEDKCRFDVGPHGDASASSTMHATNFYEVLMA